MSRFSKQNIGQVVRRRSWTYAGSRYEALAVTGSMVERVWREGIWGVVGVLWGNGLAVGLFLFSVDEGESETIGVSV